MAALPTPKSNLWLPMEYTLTRNRTYNATDNMKQYQNIRIYNHPSTRVPDAERSYVLPAIANPGGEYSVWSYPNSTTLNTFAASCWYTFQELTDYMLAKNETVIPFGLGTGHEVGEMTFWNSPLTSRI